MKYQLEISTLLTPVNAHLLFEKCEWPELNCFDREMIGDYFSNLVDDIQMDSALADWTFTIIIHVGTYWGAKDIRIGKRGIIYTDTKEKVLTIGIPLPYHKTVGWGVEKKKRFAAKIPDPSKDKNVRLIPVDFTKYDDMGSYIEDTIKIALQSLFEVGFTLKGCEVRLK